jgi:hypothetical protein
MLSLPSRRALAKAAKNSSVRPEKAHNLERLAQRGVNHLRVVLVERSDLGFYPELDRGMATRSSFDMATS